MRLARAEGGAWGDGERVTVLGAAVLLLMARLYPFDRFPLVTCPLKAWTHIPCPTCGMTRAFVRVAHGDWLAALHVNPLGAWLAFVALGAVVYGSLRLTVLRQGLKVELTSLEARVARAGAIAALLTNWAYLIVSGSAA